MRKILFFLIFLNAICLSAQYIDDSVILSPLYNDPRVDKKSFSFILYSTNKQESLLSINSFKPLIPASVNKLVTAVSAYYYLGDNFRFNTYAYLSGEQTNNIWNGNIYIYGTGDPLIGDDFPDKNNFFDSLVYILKKIGIDTINGNIIADASYFGREIVPPTYESEDLGNYYGAGASSLIYNGNVWKIGYKLTADYGKTATILFTVPEIPHVNYQNRVKVANRNYGNYTNVIGKPLEKSYIFSGTIPKGRGDTIYVKASSPDPAYGFAWKTKQSLSTNGIFLNGNLISSYEDTIVYDNKYLILNYQSMPIDSIISFTIRNSYNVGSEALAKAISKKYGDGSYKSYGSLAKKMLYKYGADTIDIKICDGSGLSRKNLLTADALLTILIASQKEYWHNALNNSLAIAGVNGTLKKFLKNTQLENNLRAKSGYLRYTRGFAGYFDLPDSMDTIAFVILVNNFKADTKYLTKNIETVLLNSYNELTNKYRASQNNNNNKN
jgi:D-alanyl-D-alanine carboxypeptidase/D-alanyl-D-alanine-endopeptidase (penicillin-binding protein 4)